MGDRLLYVPGWGLSPRGCDEMPGIRFMLNRFRELFEVKILHWPSVAGGAKVEPIWENVVKLLREAIPERGHIVADSGNVTFVLMALADGAPIVQSIVADGFDVPVATFKALGLHSLADATLAARQIESASPHSALAWTANVEEGPVIRNAFRDADWSFVPQLSESYSRLNLLESSPRVQTPTLLVKSPLPYAGWSELDDLFLRFFPEAEFVELPERRRHASESGAQMADVAIPFMQKHSGRTVLSTVLFADIVDSTVHAATMGDRRWSQVLGQFRGLAERELQKAGGKLVDTAGDGFLAVFDNPGAAVGCARSVVDGVRELGLEVRAGVHTGQVEVSGEKYSGIAVHTAARVAAKAGPGEVLVSETVRQLLGGSSAEFTDRGTHELKGLPGPVRLFAA